MLTVAATMLLCVILMPQTARADDVSEICESSLQYNQSNDGYVLNGGNYKLAEDITLNGTLIIVGNVSLDLNGRTLTITTLTGTNIGVWVCGGYRLTLSATNSGSIVGNGSQKAPIYIDSNASLDLEGGTVEEIQMRPRSTLYADGGIVNGDIVPVLPRTFPLPRITRSENATGYTTILGNVTGMFDIDDRAKVTVTFDANGGNGGQEQKLLCGQAIAAPSDPTRASNDQYSYSFAGWYTKAEGGEIANNIGTATRNVTYYAHWTQTTRQYNISWNGNGGTVDTTNATTGLVNYGTEIIAPTSPSRTGYVFAGWYDAASEGKRLADEAIVTGNITYYAHWKPITYTVKFDTNGGSGNVLDITAVYDTEFTIPSGAALNREGYSFGGWNAQADGNGVGYTAGSYEKNLTDVDNRTVTLYADWSKNVHQVNYQYRGDVPSGAPALPGVAQAAYNETIKLDDDPTLAGYRFSGWSAAGITISDGKFSMPDQDVTFTGTWSRKQMPKIEVKAVTEKTYGDSEFDLDVYTNSDGMKTFESDNENVVTVDSSGRVKITGVGTATITVKVAESADYLEGERSVTIDVRAYTVTFNSNGAGIADSVQTVNKDRKLDSLPSVTRDGYEFDGWYTEENGGEQITTDTVFSGATTVYAHWTKIETPEEPSEPTRPVRPPYRPSGSSSSSVSNRTSNTPVVPTEEKSAGNPFTDVKKGSFYYDAVQWAVKKGITVGISKTTFGPNDPCKRGQMVTFLWRMAGSPDVKGEMPFADIKEGSYYYKAVLWAHQNGITSGTSKNVFSPYDDCSRDQMAVFLHRMSKEKYDAKDSGFTDVKDNAYYAASVAWLKKAGITAGTSNTEFSPADSCSRGQMVTFLYRYSQKKK